MLERAPIGALLLEGSYDQIGSRHHRRLRHLRFAGPCQCSRATCGDAVGRAIGRAAHRRHRRTAGRVPAAPRQGPQAVAIRHQLPRQYRRAEAGRRHRSGFALGLRFFQGRSAARQLCAGRSIRRPHLQTRELILRERLGRTRLDGASGLAAAPHQSRSSGAKPKASRSRAAEPMSASKGPNFPLWPKA